MITVGDLAATFFAGMAIGTAIMTYVMHRQTKQFKKTNDLWSEACKTWMGLYQKARDEVIVAQTLMRANAMMGDDETPGKRLLN